MQIHHRLAILALGAILVPGQAMPETQAIEINGRKVPVDFAAESHPKGIEIPRGDLVIQMDPKIFGDKDLANSGGGGSQTPRRLRYKLEGRDANWREFDTDMRLAVVFYDSRNDWVAQKEYPIVGTSPGWNGSLETSPLVPRREVLEIPEKAAKFCVVLASAGSPTAVGTLAIASLRVFKAGESENASPLLQLQFPPRGEGTGAGPQDWNRSGDRPSMGHMIAAPAAPAGWLLALIDEDVGSHGEWRSPGVPIHGKPGERLQVDWLQSFSIALGQVRPAIHYRDLEPGHHLFRLERTTPAGCPTGEEQSIPLVVYPPFWQRPWFILLSGMVTAALGFGVLRFFSWRHTQREIASLRQQNALEAERARIAQDIHDDLGATLTHISMLSQSVSPESNSFSELSDNLIRINQATREMSHAMDEIVWALNPRNDRLDRLQIFFSAYAQEFLSSAGIDFRCNFPEQKSENVIPAAKRHALFLAFKEALSNAVQHAHCRMVTIGMDVAAQTFTLSLADDGNGFAMPLLGGAGNGLTNMRTRLESLGGRFSLESSPGLGCKVVFEMPLEE